MRNIIAEAAGAAHDVLIGALADATERLRDLAGGRPVPLVTDDRVLALWGRYLADIVDFEPLVITEGEAAKDWTTLKWLVEGLASLDVTRTTPILALGGGSVGDVAGLAAALFKRGCPVVHLPTTLLAQVDSAIGGKTAIDAAGQKNLVGAFHMPALVVIDPAFLATLDGRQLRSGYAELVKYGLIDNPEFFAWCEAKGGAVLAGEEEARLHAIGHCVEAKARIVAGDFQDRLGRRALLNLGHSFGHAIEALAGFAVFHGEAVALGLCLAFDLSVELGHCPPADRDRVHAHLLAAGLPTRLASVGLADRATELVPLMLHDKKADGSGAMTLILARGIGAAFVARGIAPGQVADFLARAA